METLWPCTTPQGTNGLGVVIENVGDPHVLEMSTTLLDSKIWRSGFAATEKSSGFTPAAGEMELIL